MQEVDPDFLVHIHADYLCGRRAGCSVPSPGQHCVPRDTLPQVESPTPQELLRPERIGTRDFPKCLEILDHSGIEWNCWTGTLGHLGVGRANALQVKASQGPDAYAARVPALAPYKAFLTLWKDAALHIPILKEAKAENAKLQ